MKLSKMTFDNICNLSNTIYSKIKVNNIDATSRLMAFMDIFEKFDKCPNDQQINFIANCINSYNDIEEESRIIGKYGEDLTKCYLIASDFHYKIILNNIMLPIGNTETEIDLLMICDRGIFIIESKNIGGAIYGSIEDVYWTQTYGNKSYKFINPIDQNKVHSAAIKKIIDLNCIYNLIIFSDRCKLKKIPPQNNIMHRKKLYKYITDNDFPIIWNKEQVEAIYSIIKRQIINVNLKDHADKIMNTRKDVLHKKCPICNHYLIKRHGKYGDFIGCVNWPQCEYIQK